MLMATFHLTYSTKTKLENVLKSLWQGSKRQSPGCFSVKSVQPDNIILEWLCHVPLTDSERKETLNLPVFMERKIY